MFIKPVSLFNEERKCCKCLKPLEIKGSKYSSVLVNGVYGYR